MRRENLTDLNIFPAVAEERSFTRAAARLGLTQSTLGHAMWSFEERLGVRLLARPTRGVAPTEAGSGCFRLPVPRLEAIAAELATLSEFRDKPAGTVRITTRAHAYETVLWPALKRLLPTIPTFTSRLSSSTASSISWRSATTQAFRLDDQVESDMISVRVGPELRFIVVSSPSYLAGRTAPTTPQDLTTHRCINFRHSTSRGPLRLGEGRSGPERPGPGAARLQRRVSGNGGGHRGLQPRLCAR